MRMCPRVCPACHNQSLPSIKGSEDAVCCQNPDCGVIFNREDEAIGFWNGQCVVLLPERKSS